jgi:hypothetical protein
VQTGKGNPSDLEIAEIPAANPLEYREYVHYNINENILDISRRKP